MLTLDRHIWFRVIKGYALVLAILLSIFSLMAFVNELDMVGRGTYGIADAALNILLAILVAGLLWGPPWAALWQSRGRRS